MLHGCGTTTPTTSTPSREVAAEKQKDAQYWQSLAAKSSGSQRAVYQLSAAESLYFDVELEQALFTLLAIDTAVLPANKLIDYSMLLAEVYQLQGQYQLVQEALDIPVTLKKLGSAEPTKQAAWAERSGNIRLVLGEYDAASEYFDWALSLVNEPQLLARLRKSLWQSLTQTASLPTGPYYSAEMTGWIDLARISNRGVGTLSEQVEDLQGWRILNGSHPASLQPPESIRVLENIVGGDAPRIAILLPLSGDLAAVGNAVLEGYIATSLKNKGYDPLNPREILVFDTNEDSLSNIVNELKKQDIDAVIGPLRKPLVAEYVNIADPRWPTLTLNSIEPQQAGLHPNALGLALDIEDEARQAATAALRDGYQTALALVPTSNSGQRAGRAFSDTWQEQHGELVAIDTYTSSETHADLLEARLHVDQSYARMRAMRSLLAKNIEFTPRRRQDIDMLFLVGAPEQARQIKPMLAFFFADDIPIYSTSMIYNGEEDSQANSDLNGIKFSTLPWIISSSKVDKSLSASAPQKGTLLQLQAMGVDAYYLSQRITQFLVAEGTVYHGVLGKLSLQPEQRNLDRQQAWAQFQSGSVIPAL